MSKREDPIDLLRRGVELWPEEPEYREHLAVALAQKGEVKEAVGHFEALVKMSPESPDAQFNFGCALLELGRFDDSICAFKAYLQKRPHSAQALTNLGAAYIGTGRHSDAESALQRALMRDPKMVDAFSNLGTVQSIRGRYGEAEQSFRKGLDHAPNHVGMQVKLGWILIRKGDWDESRQCFEAALRVNPRMLRAISGLATVYEREGRLQDALDVMSPFVQEGTLLPIFAQTYALVCRRMNKPDRALGIVEACLQRERSTEEEAGLLHAYGDLLDRLKRSSEAFQAHTLANKARNHPHDSEAHARYVAAIVRAFGRRQLSEMPRSSSQASPIFVVGMPRSGTSLVEQILASHTQVFGAGEQEGLLHLAAKIPFQLRDRRPYPDCMERASASDLDTWSEEYLRSLPKEAADSAHFVDKMPFNFLHIGLISRLFPKARIVHCRRDPQDTCLSVFFQQFSPYYAFSTDLVGLAKYYRDYRSLMAHWDRVFPGKIVSVQYEELVASPEELIPKMLDDCGLSMEESCLRFWENPRQVDTASYAQVRRPLYSSSIGRSEAYADQLAPLRTILDLR